MRITRETLFAIINIQTISVDGTMINLFNQKGEAEYFIEVVGIKYSKEACDNRPMDEQQRRT